MMSHNTFSEQGSTPRTRRRTLRAIGGLVLGASTVGTVSARGQATEIDESTVIDEPGKYILTSDIAAEEGAVIRIEADRVTLDGNNRSITNLGYADSGILVNGTNATLRNLSLSEFWYGGSGISFSDGTGCTVVDTVISDGYHGITGGDGVTIKNCTITRMQSSGIVAGSNITIQNNDIINIDFGDAISLSGVNNKVIDNYTSSGYEALKLTGDHNVIQNNVFEYGLDEQILLRGSSNNTIIDNTVVHTGWAVYVNPESNNNTVARNDLRNNDVGVNIDGNHNTVVRNDVRDNRITGIIDDGEKNRVNANIRD